MCDAPVPCSCTLERRVKLRAEHIARHEAFREIAWRMRDQLTEDEKTLLYRQADEEWDDAIHIASPDDLLRSLCGNLGRSLVDLPDRPDSNSGCWTCLTLADAIAPVAIEEEPVLAGVVGDKDTPA